MKKQLVSVVLAGILSVGFVSFVEAKVLAVVDGVEITEDVFDEIKTQNPGFDFSKLPSAQQKELVDQAINNVLIAKEAQKNKLDSTKEFQDA